MNQAHLHLPSLRVLVLFHRDANCHLVEDGDGRLSDGDSIILRVELHILLEHHQTLNTQSKINRQNV